MTMTLSPYRQHGSSAEFVYNVLNIKAQASSADFLYILFCQNLSNLLCCFPVDLKLNGPMMNV